MLDRRLVMILVDGGDAVRVQRFPDEYRFRGRHCWKLFRHDFCPKNTGGGTLTGGIDASCEHYDIIPVSLLKSPSPLA